jgi:uncharacterized membrane protein
MSSRPAPQPAEPLVLPKGRLEALTDGIFAVTMTLLVLDLKLPEHIDFGDSIGAALDDLLPRFDHYVISFVVLCVFWVAHLRVMRRIRDIDAHFLWLNLAFLLCTTFVPAFTAFVGNNPGHPRPAILYGLDLIALLAFEALMWRRGLLHLANDSVHDAPLLWRWVRDRFLFAVAIVLLGMGLAVMQAQLGMRTRYASYVYLLLIGAGVVRPRLRMDRAVHAVRKVVSASRE